MKYNEQVKVVFKKKYKHLTAPLWGRTDIKGERVAFLIPKGFRTDFASIPRLFWLFIAPSDSTILVPAIIHDYLYSRRFVLVHKMKDGKLSKERIKIRFSRVEADLILREKMKSFKANIIKRTLVFIIVRLFGWINYK